MALMKLLSVKDISSQSATFTNVTTAASWQQGKARLITKPEGSGFLMTDLQKYMNIISTMHKHYDEYFEYRADLLKTKRFGIVVKVGSCTMMNDPL